MDYTQTLAELNITLGDSSDTTFTPEEKGRALEKAWNDSYVVGPVWDATTTFASDTFSYAVPTAVGVVKDIYIRRGATTFPDPIPSNAYEIVDGNIQFNSSAQDFLTDGDVLYVKGVKKLDYSADTLATTALQEYVIALAGYNTLTLLTFKKANLFLKNDTTMAELITLRRELEGEVKRYRAMLPKEFESA